MLWLLIREAARRAILYGDDFVKLIGILSLPKKYQEKKLEHYRKATEQKEDVPESEIARRAQFDMSSEVAVRGMPMPGANTGSKSLDNIVGNTAKQIGEALSQKPKEISEVDLEEFKKNHSELGRKDPFMPYGYKKLPLPEPLYIQNAKTKLKLLNEYEKQVKAEKFAGSDSIGKLGNQEKRKYVNEQKNQVKQELYNKHSELLKSLENISDPETIILTMEEVKLIGDVLESTANGLKDEAKGAYNYLFDKPDQSSGADFHLNATIDQLPSLEVESMSSSISSGSIAQKPYHPDDYYDLITGEINYDITQRIQTLNKSVDFSIDEDFNISINPDYPIETMPKQPEIPGIASQPFDIANKIYSNPNARRIARVLYWNQDKSIKERMKDELKDYAKDRAISFGKQALRDAATGKTKNLYDLASQLKGFARNEWQAISRGVKAIGKATYTAAKAAYGFAKSAATWVASNVAAIGSAIGSAISAAAGAIATAVTAVASAAAAAASWVAGAVIALFFSW